MLAPDTCSAHSHCIRTHGTCTAHTHCIRTHDTCTAQSHCKRIPGTCTVQSHCIFTPVLPTVTAYFRLYCPSHYILKSVLPTVTGYVHLYCPQSLYTDTCTADSHCILTPVPPSHCIILTPDQHSDRPVLVTAFHLTAVQPRVTAADRLDVVN